MGASYVSQIYERKDGKLTGRVLYLCPTCEMGFYKREIKNLNISTNYKLGLEKWNKNKF